MVHLEEIVAFLNSTFNVDHADDFPNAFNGLQLANDGHVHKIVGAVDANPASIERAMEQKALIIQRLRRHTRSR